MEPLDTTMSVNRTIGINSSTHRMMSFDEATVIRRCYQRNNRKGGQKNLRCFPNCCQGVHASTGYCGGPIVVHLTHPVLKKGADYMLFAEFCPVVNGVPDGSLHEGDVWPVEKALSLAHKEKNPLLPLFQGSPMDGAPHAYCFNASKKGWHYGFVSNKHVSEMHHVLMVYLLERRPDTALHCIDTLVSVSFSIYCRRRAKTSRLGELLSADPTPLVPADERKRKDAAIDAPKVRPPSRSSDTDWMILNELLSETAPQDKDPPSSPETTSSQEDEDLQVIKRIKLPPPSSSVVKEEVTSPSTSPADTAEFVAPPGFYSVAQVKAALGIADVFKFPPKNLRAVDVVAKAPSAMSTTSSTATSTATSTAASTRSSAKASVTFPSPMRSYDPQREFTQSAPHLSRQTHRRVRGHDMHEALSQSTPTAPHQLHRPVSSPLRHRSQSALHANSYAGPFFANPAQQLMFQQQQQHSFMYPQAYPGGFSHPGMMTMPHPSTMGYPQMYEPMGYGFQSPAFTRMNSTPMSTPSSSASPYQSPQPYTTSSGTPSPVYTTPPNPSFAFPTPDPSAPSMTILEELLLEDDSVQMAVPYPSRDVTQAYYQRQDTVAAGVATVTPCLPLDLKPSSAPAPIERRATDHRSRDTVIPTEIVVTPRGRTARVHLGRGHSSNDNHTMSPVAAPTTSRRRSTSASSSSPHHLSINMDELMSSRSIYLRMGSPSQPSFVRLVASKSKKRNKHRRRRRDSDNDDDESTEAAPAVAPANKPPSLVALVSGNCNLILKALAFVTLCVVLVYYSTHVAAGMKPEEPTQTTSAEMHAIANTTDIKLGRRALSLT
ncbi:hypothetical protein SPRG_04418 [Saprolegnia parasitica CBS 223.65]|uniref:Uncharacterized protein n=1 Tax=Saprolegnia parasitica (strain CBS 223.65) TaxID=695850 RepID=A0A067CUP4_SAPPC|nr:hypothetical protein SPRG_04418 [Saprolegnia parasitica CBS 223.65]KDO30517.1 hypothetical protein SPRG_04418 [Saprolegnia parasitica CBS 223.65]|eukprot:XP_012198732.1 hypothetical protein SPRG_04418 [Saprolegnia parasitica CBS 223.65]